MLFRKHIVERLPRYAEGARDFSLRCGHGGHHDLSQKCAWMCGAAVRISFWRLRHSKAHLVVVFEVNFVGISALEGKCYPPIGRYRDCVPALEVPRQPVEAKPRQIQVLRQGGRIQPVEDHLDAIQAITRQL